SSFGRLNLVVDSIQFCFENFDSLLVAFRLPVFLCINDLRGGLLLFLCGTGERDGEQCDYYCAGTDRNRARRGLEAAYHTDSPLKFLFVVDDGNESGRNVSG